MTDEFLGPNLSTFGIALANREIARVEAGGTDMKAGPPRGTVSEQLAVLKMAKDVFSLLDSGTLLDRVSQPALWHTDLHLGNIFVNSDDPTQITCIIDWQSINVAPIFLQARFPDFLPIDEDYDFSTTALPKPPPNYEQMDADEKEFTMLRLKEARLAKAYEISSAIQNKRGYRALAIPSFLRGLFTHCENITEEGILPLRNCLIDLSKQWDDVEFTANCPIVFSEAEIEMHNRQYQEYLDFQKVQKLARILLSTDEEGWIDPRLDISQKLVQNEQVLKEVMRRSDQYHMSPEKVKSIWPFLGRSEVSTPTLSLN